MSVVDVIAALGTGTYTVTRTAAGSTDAAGDYTMGATSTFSIVASVQPMGSGHGGGEILKSLPEGRHADDVRVVYTTTALRTKPIADRIALDGDTFDIFEVEKWEAFGTTHYRAYASRRVVP